jgi:hypothetical protein
MCDCQPADDEPSAVTRRDVVVGAVAAAAAIASAGLLGGRRVFAEQAVAAVEVKPGLSIYPRDAWGAALPPRGPIEVETPQFLLVHHTASSNSYASAAAVIQSTYAFQTSAAKGWNDVCYEFFIGRDGDVWEGRSGALAGPVVADATGGSQGFAQLVCMIGDFTAQLPTAAAQDALVKVLAWLAERNSIDIGDGATTTFVSRGSQRWRAGTVVTTPTIAGHRDMSFTACPGDAFYPVLPSIRSQAITQRSIWATGLRPARRLGFVTP